MVSTQVVREALMRLRSLRLKPKAAAALRTGRGPGVCLKVFVIVFKSVPDPTPKVL